MLKEQIGILGGCFNPIHNRHIELACCAQKTLSLQRVLFIPTNNPPHKLEKLADGVHRLEMTKLACFPYRNFEVSEIEVKRKGTCYTIDTLNILRKQYPDATFYFIIGEDTLFELLNWHLPEEVFALTEFAVCPRKGMYGNIEAITKTLTKKGAVLHFLPIVENDVSSTSIRNALMAGEMPETLPPQVQMYIRIMGLYGTKKSPINADCYYNHLKGVMNEKRFVHSLLTSYTARKLAEIHHADVEDATVAGLLHDCAKCLSLATQQSIAKDHFLKLDSNTLKSTNLLHGPVGAVLARRDYGIENENVLSAIRCHTTGKVGMLPIDMILYLADKTEPSRITYPDLEVVRVLAKKSLISAMRYSLHSSIKHITAQKRIPHPQTKKAENWLSRLELEEEKEQLK